MSVVLSAFVLTGCGSSKRVTAQNDGYETSTATKQGKSEDPLSKGLADAIVRVAHQWVGTPYRYGGESREGTDCSGFVMSVFKDAANIKIPRSTLRQREFCHKIDIDKASPGDLVFFTPSKRNASAKVSHVGLYIGNGRMIHASSSRGVIVSSLDEKYWSETFHSAGRIINHTIAVKTDNAPQKVCEKEIRAISLDDVVTEKADSLFNSLLD